METNICSYSGIEQESISLVHWPSEPVPLLNIGAKDPLCADVDSALAQAKAKIKALMQVALEGPFALCGAFERDVAMLALTPATFAAEVLSQCSNEDFFAEVQRYHEAALSIPQKASDKCVVLWGGLRSVCCVHVVRTGDGARGCG